MRQMQGPESQTKQDGLIIFKGEKMKGERIRDISLKQNRNPKRG